MGPHGYEGNTRSIGEPPNCVTIVGTTGPRPKALLDGKKEQIPLAQSNPKADLFSPIDIKGMVVRNRIILPALILNYPLDGTKPGPQWEAFYRRRAKGGAGLIIVGACYVHRAGQMDRHQLGADSDEWQDALATFARAIKEEGATAALQLNHAGRYSRRDITGMDPVAPTALASRYTKETPRELSTDEVGEVIACFARAAALARKSGYDAVEILAANGYIISQFLSPLTNRRNDRYGPGMEGGMVFIQELVEAIKAEAGDDFPLIFRLSSIDNIPGGLDDHDQRRVASKLAQWGAALLNVTAGWHDAMVPQIASTVPQGNFIPYAAKIKSQVDIPVSCAVRITDPKMAREAVASGRLDMVTMARALMADPDWPNKAQAGQDQDIRSCICCCHCFDTAFARSRIDCSINADLTGAEPAPAVDPKRILVMGGGPGGMEAARVMAERGHRVVICEKEAGLGGKLIQAAAPPHKQEIMGLVRYLSGQLEKLGVEVRLNCLNLDDAASFDGIVAAGGGVDRVLPIKGIDKLPLYMSSDILVGMAEPRGPVVVVGAGLVGAETADYLSTRGLEVSLVEIQKRPLADMGISTRWVLLGRLKAAGVRFHTSSQVKEIRKNQVVIDTPEGEKTLKAGCLVMAVGSAPGSELEEAVKATGVPYCLIGDQKEPRRIREAIKEGYRAAMEWVDTL